METWLTFPSFTRISDEGGGVEYDAVEHIWQYGYTTVKSGLRKAQEPGSTTVAAMGGGASGSSQFRLGGLGFGLPFSRLHARYFGMVL